jgi:hypothetical protein
MDLFDFTEALRRRKRLLIIGTILIIGFVLYTGFDFSNGIALRAKPRYESSIQIAVVPADLDSLAESLPNPGAMAGTASLYANLLSTPEATAEIMEETGARLVESLTVATTGRDGFIGVRATARDPEGAKQAALYSFTWLDQRLADPLAIVRVEQPEEISPSILDEDGRFEGTVRVEASPAFAETAAGTWISLATGDAPVTFSLADAAVQPAERETVLEPDSDLLIALEDVLGSELDAMVARIPPLPGPDTVPYTLTVRLDRGALQFPLAPASSVPTEAEPLSGPDLVLSDPSLVERHVVVAWEPVISVLGADAGEQPVAAEALGLLLLTENPVAVETGSRRGPVLILASLVGGFFALITIAITVDAWSRARREGRAQAEQPTAAELRGIDSEPQKIDGEAKKADKIRGTG